MPKESRGRGVVCAGGELRKHPLHVLLGIDAEQAARAEHAVNHGRHPPGFGMTDKHHVLQGKFRRTEAVFESVVVYSDMSSTELGIRSKRRPVVMSIVQGFFQFAEARSGTGATGSA
jgi:hypothetical protein